MKKAMFFLVSAIIMAMSASASSLFLLSVDTALSTTHSLTFQVDPSGFSGPFFVEIQTRQSGTSTWVSDDTTRRNSSVQFYDSATNLMPNTTYFIRCIVLDTLSQTSDTTTAIVYGTTLPLPQNATVTLIGTVSALPTSKVVWSASSIGTTSLVFGINANTGATLTDTIILVNTTVSNDTANFLTDTAGHFIPGGFMVIVPLTNGVSGNQSASWSSFQVPAYTRAAIVSLDTASLAQTSLTITTSVTVGNGGPVTSKMRVYNSNGSTLVYAFAPTVLLGDSTLHYPVPYLTADSIYLFVEIISNSAGTTMDTLRAKTLPYTKPSITLLDTSSVMQTGWLITTSVAVGNGGPVTTQMKVYHMNGSLFHAFGSVFTVTDSAFSYAVMGAAPDSMYMIVEMTFNSTGTARDTFYVKTSSYTMPVIVWLTTPIIGIDSVQISTKDNPGNGGAAISDTKLIDSTTGLVVHDWTQSDTAITTTAVSQHGLIPHHAYKIIHTLTVPNVGADTAVWSFNTLQVGNPGVSFVDTLGATISSYSFQAFIQTNGPLWNAAKVFKVSVTDAQGTQVFTVSVADTATLSFTVTGRTPATTYTPTITVTDSAGLTASASFTVRTATPDPGFVPLLSSNNESIDPTTVVLNNVSWPAHVGPGIILVGARNDGTTYVDTLIGMVNIVGPGTGNITITGQPAGTKIWYQLMGESDDDLIAGNGIEAYVVTIAPANPDVKNIVATSLTVNSISGVATFNGEGTLAQGETQIFQAGVFLQTSGIVQGGIAQFTQNFDYQNLVSGTAFEVRATASESQTGNNPIEMSRFWSTLPNATGIIEITAEEYLETVPMDAYDITGRYLGTGLRRDLLSKANAGDFGRIATVFIGPEDPSLFRRFGKATQYHVNLK